MLLDNHKKLEYRKDVQGLRALAVVFVIIFHFNKDWLPGGFIGVDIFLVISGFLITSIVLNKNSNNEFLFIEFYLNRFKRIVPAYLFLLLVTSIFMSALLTTSDFNLFYDSLKQSLYFNSNQYFSGFGNYFAPNSNELPLLHTWSLAVEMQFYIFLPVILIFIPSRYLKVIIVSFSLLVVAYSTHKMMITGEKSAFYFSMLARAPEFLIGSYCAFCKDKYILNRFNKNILSTLGLSLIVVSLLTLDDDSLFPGVFSLPVCIGTALIIYARNGVINHVLSKSLLVWIGGLSYSLYLWHWPILSGIRYYTESYYLDHVWSGVFLFFTLSLSYFSFRFIESGKILGNYKFKSKYKTAGFVFSSVLLIILSKNINESLVDIPSKSLTRYAPSGEICHGKVNDYCLKGSIDSKSSVLVIGDSHAAQLNIAFDQIGLSNNYSFNILTASNCVTIPDFDVYRISEWARKSCVEQIGNVKDILSEYQTVILAGMWSYHSTSEKFLKALESFFSLAEEQSINVIVLSQIPMLDSNPMRIQRFSDLNLDVHVVKSEKWKGSNNKIKDMTELYTNSYFYDVSDGGLFNKAPFYNDTLIYMDESHLNEFGSRFYGESFGEGLISTIERFQ